MKYEKPYLDIVSLDDEKSVLTTVSITPEGDNKEEIEISGL